MGQHAFYIISKFIHLVKLFLTDREKPRSENCIAAPRKNNRDKWSKVENEPDSREASHHLYWTANAKQFYILVNNDGCIKRKIAQHTVAKSRFLFKNQVLNNSISVQPCWSSRASLKDSIKTVLILAFEPWGQETLNELDSWFYLGKKAGQKSHN